MVLRKNILYMISTIPINSYKVVIFFYVKIIFMKESKMKKFILFFCILCLMIPIYSSDEITSETTIQVLDGNTIKNMTVEEFWNELDNSIKIIDYSYRLEDGTVVIPMNPDIINACKEQQNYNAYEEEIETRGESYSAEYREDKGVKDRFSVFIDTAMKIFGDSSTRSLHGHFYAGVCVFNNDFNIIALDINADNNEQKPFANASFKVCGQTKWAYQQSFYQNWEVSDFPLVEVEAIFPIAGPLSVSVTVSILGELRLYVGLELYDEGIGIAGNVRPGATLTTQIDASPVNVLEASLNIIGSIDLLDISMSFTAYITYSPDMGILFELKIPLRIEALKGHVDFAIEVIGEPIIQWTLFEWDAPIIEDRMLYDQHN